MPVEDPILSQIADRFQAVLQIAERALGAEKTKFFDIDERSSCEQPSPETASMEQWTMLLRSLNLGEAAILAARHGHAETVALIARCLAEMVYHACCWSENTGLLEEYWRHNLDNIQRYMRAAGRWLPRSISNALLRTKFIGILDQAEAEMGELKQELGDDSHWYCIVKERARKAGLLEDYETTYAYLSQHVHTGPLALVEHWVQHEHKWEVRRRIWQVAARCVLRDAIWYWLVVSGELMSMLQLDITPALHEAVAACVEYIGSVDLHGASEEACPW